MLSTDGLSTIYHPSDQYCVDIGALAPVSPHVADRDAIRLSTRKALRQRQRMSLDNLQHQRAVPATLEPAYPTPPRDALDLRTALLTTPPPRKGSSAPSQATQQSSSDVGQQNQQGGTLMKTIRRVFSRGKQVNSTESRPRHSAKKEEFETHQQLRRQYRLGSSAQLSAGQSSQGSVNKSYPSDNTISQRYQDGKEAKSHRGASAKANQSGKQSQEPTTPRLKRATSTVYRVTTLDASHSRLQSISPSYYTPPSASPRQVGSSAPSPPNKAMPVLPEPLDVRSEMPNMSHSPSSLSPRDSLDILREKYNSRRSEDRHGQGIMGDDDGNKHQHQLSSSSMSIGIGSMRPMNSPDPILTGTEPRRVMEAAGLYARLQDLEARLEEVENSISKLKSSPYDISGQDARNRSEDMTVIVPKPPSTLLSPLNRTQDAQDTFLRSSSSTPQSENDSSPSTPTGLNADSMAISDVRTFDPYSDPPRSGQGREEEQVLRWSMLDKGYHDTIHHIFDVVNAEHNARVALEADVHSLRNAFSALQQEYQTNQSNTENPRSIVPDSHQKRDNLASDVEGLEALPTDAGVATRTPIPPPNNTSAQEERQPVPVERRPLEYNDLWSHAAVPIHPQASPSTSPQHTPSGSNDLAWSSNTPLVSKFSFDETEDDEEDARARAQG